MTGVVLGYALKTPPSTAWMLCYGQALVTGNATTARLRQKLITDGYPYGKDASNNPLIPDVRGRVIAGPDNMGGTAAGRLSGTPGATVGGALGSQTRALTVAEMPSHSHAVTDPGHAHGITAFGPAGGSGIAAGSGYNGGGAAISTGTTGVSLQSTGSGAAHDITQPTLVLNKIIKL